MKISNAKHIKPGYVLIKQETVEKVTQGGIVLSSESLEDRQRKIRPTSFGIVINVAEDVADFKVGDRVLYSTWAPIVFPEGEGEEKIEYHLVDQYSVLALIE